MKSKNKIAALALSVLLIIPVIVGCAQTEKQGAGNLPETSAIVASPKPENHGNKARPSEPVESIAEQSEVAERVVSDYQAIEDSVVNRYQAIEDSAVSSYNAIENHFVETYLTGDDANTPKPEWED